MEMTPLYDEIIVNEKDLKLKYIRTDHCIFNTDFVIKYSITVKFRHEGCEKSKNFLIDNDIHDIPSSLQIALIDFYFMFTIHRCD